LKAGAVATRIGRKPGVHQVLQAAELADQPPLLALAIGVLGIGLVRRDRRLARGGARMLAARGMGIGAAKLGKKMIGRTRPSRLVDQGQHKVEVLGPEDDAWKSFPSAHTAGSVAVARAFARDYPGFHTPALSAAVTAGAMKVFKGDHF